MGLGIKRTILFLIIIFSVLVGQSYSKCGGGSGLAGGSSYNFLGDRAVDMDMPSFDEFIRDNIDNHQSTLPAKILSQSTMSNTNPSINQTNKGNGTLNSSTIYPIVNNTANTIPNNTIVKLGAAGSKDKKGPTFAVSTFDNNMI
jgi:hypothetical protein